MWFLPFCLNTTTPRHKHWITLWFNYCSSILICLFALVSWLILHNILFMSLTCSEIFSESSWGSLVFLKDHFIFLVFLPTLPSILFYFNLGKLTYLLSLEPVLCFVYYSYLEFALITTIPQSTQMLPVLQDWAQILSLKVFFVKSLVSIPSHYLLATPTHICDKQKCL